MNKSKFIGEYSINASRKMLFPYISTASGLSQWFADDVNITEDKVYTMLWDGEVNRARIVSIKANQHIKFEFEGEDDDDLNSIEIRLEMNELTQEVYIKITDYSDIDDQEVSDLWEGLIHDLKEIVGG
ncbi:START-like domain-containing protein [Cyclobacteriaceae bacterium]|nr:START-like domain-containing protein [Cyclobacteriaceae bacterium]MDC6483923.1 START-like domain-containing protein [Cyclobacteriaceae bacterium]